MATYTPILPKPDSEKQRIDALFAQLEGQLSPEGFGTQQVIGKDTRWLIVYSQKDIVDDEAGPLQAARILIHKDGNFQFQVFLVTIEIGKIDDASFRDCLVQMKAESDFQVCPGILTQYLEIKDEIERKPKNLRLWATIKRADSLDCHLWFNPKDIERRFGKYACMPCQSLLKSIRQSKKRAKDRAGLPERTPPKKMALIHMTPQMRAKVLGKKNQELSKLKRLLKSLNAERSPDSTNEPRHVISNNEVSDEPV